MFSVGQTVVFGLFGVCTITDITSMQIDGESMEYYVLSPAHDSKSSIYVPVNKSEATADMRPVISAQELEELLGSVSGQDMEWISDDNVRKEFCEDILKSGDRKALMLMIDMLYVHKEHQKSKKRRFPVVDDNYLKKAEKLLNSEFAYVLGIAPEDVPAYIIEKVKGRKSDAVE